MTPLTSSSDHLWYCCYQSLDDFENRSIALLRDFSKFVDVEVRTCQYKSPCSRYRRDLQSRSSGFWLSKKTCQRRMLGLLGRTIAVEVSATVVGDQGGGAYRTGVRDKEEAEGEDQSSLSRERLPSTKSAEGLSC